MQNLYRESLPDGCPPEESEYINAARIVFRLVGNDPPTDDDFMSHLSAHKDQTAGSTSPTDTLVYYDGVQIFEGRDSIGGHYVGVMIDSPDDSDMYLVAGVDPIQLKQFRSGSLDLKTLLLEVAEHGWYTTCADDDSMQLLVLEVQEGPLQEREFLPDDDFLLDEDVVEDRMDESEADRHNAAQLNALVAEDVVTDWLR